MPDADLAVYWINLVESRDRCNSMQQQFFAHGITNHQKVEAVSPISLGSYDILTPPDSSPMTDKEYCCTISHLRAIWTAFSDGCQEALIMEDDMRIIRWPGKAAVWNDLKKTTSKKWEILQLFAMGSIATSLLSETSLWVPWRSGIWSTGAYVISKKGMQRILQKYVPQQVSRNTWPFSCHVQIDFRAIADIERVRCVADFALYVAVNTLTCTDVFFNETAEDSTIDEKDLACHRQSTKIIDEFADEKKFKFTGFPV